MKKATVALAVLVGILWIAYSMTRPEAPLKDGLYLTYDYGGSAVTVTFSEMSGGKFSATVSPGNSEKVVDKRLRTKRGAAYDAEVFGPLWISPSSVKVGGNAHGESVQEVKRWKNWDVGVVKASFGAGAALRGEWYYEKNTGFLVGGNRTTIASDEGDGLHYVLTGSNLEQLQP